MVQYVADYKYIESNGVNLFTVFVLPNATGKFPTIIMRAPYVDRFEDMKEGLYSIHK